MPPRSPSPPRRSLPQPVEQSQGSNQRAKNGSTHATHQTGEAKPARRALPHPVETSSGGSRRHTKASDDRPSQSSSSSRPLPQPVESSSSSSKPRRFAPQMVETSRRSRRNTNESTEVEDQDSADMSPERSTRRSRRTRPDVIPCPPGNTPACSSMEVPQLPPESRFSSSNLAERQHRRHSFRIPDLPSIISSETEDDSNASDVPSLSRHSSADSPSGRRAGSKKRKKTFPIASRESEDERFSGYLLTLAASAAEKQLRDQAMAAYPNENIHEPVDHYAIDRDSEPDSDREVHVGNLAVESSEDEKTTTWSQRRQRKSRRESAAGWDMAEMRSHQADLESQRQKAWLEGNAGATRDRQPEHDMRRKSIQQNNAPGAPQPPKSVMGWQKDNESAAMRRAAAPPMAGSDLKFSKCLSPRQTRLDPHQYPAGSKKSTPAASTEPTGLWTAGPGLSGKGSRNGLWMGVNAAGAQPALTPQGVNTGLMTPARERSDPDFNFTMASPSRPSSPSPAGRQGSRGSRSLKAGLAMTSVISSPAIEHPPQLPPTPPSSVPPDAAPHMKKQPTPTETELREEFPDSFVTQVYNYLSLGYPVLARPYDDELARITSVDIERLRQDDENALHGLVGAGAHEGGKRGSDPPNPPPSLLQQQQAYARGYVGVPEGTGADARGTDADAGERWKALRLYVWEWGRQQRGIWDAEEEGIRVEGGGDEGAYERWGGGGAQRKSSWGW